MPIARTASLLALACLACSAGACGDIGSGSVTGAALEVSDCGGPGQSKRFEPFALTLDFASVNEQHGAATVRMAPRANRLVALDQVGIAIYDLVSLRAALEADGSATLPVASTAEGVPADLHGASISLTLLGSCNDASAALGSVGSLVITAFGKHEGDPVTGSFDVDIIDRRTGEVVGPGMHGEFDFEIATGTPYTAFSPKDF
ncbi:MAG: hypothetical protein U1F43_26465 [Myxococcota bacterium]